MQKNFSRRRFDSSLSLPYNPQWLHRISLSQMKIMIFKIQICALFCRRLQSPSKKPVNILVEIFVSSSRPTHGESWRRRAWEGMAENSRNLFKLNIIMHTFQFLRWQGERLQWSWEPSSSSFRIPSSVWQIRQKTTHEKNNSKYTDEADDDSDRWGNGWRGQRTKSESMKKCKCKHTINCWHKTHKFRRKLNYVTQQLNSIYMVVILAFCSGRVFLSVVAGGRFGERSENCERFSSVSRIRLERKKW